MSAGVTDGVDGPDEVEAICSAKGCQAPATHELLWNNPKIHTPQRRKVWLACDAHREHLEEFLGLRGFLDRTVPVEQIPEDAG